MRMESMGRVEERVEETVAGVQSEVIFPLEITEAFQPNDRRVLEAYVPMVFQELARPHQLPAVSS
jgi:hypothetical protein